MIATDILFQPISIRNVEIKNRYVMAPMVMWVMPMHRAHSARAR